ncbi:MAG: hypothetical protein QOH61_385 [Chloroflexota bacterium]|jgi:hypothetical protein|nr:hypothetical protein [Chloroflexota bacterium]
MSHLRPSRSWSVRVSIVIALAAALAACSEGRSTPSVASLPPGALPSPVGSSSVPVGSPSSPAGGPTAAASVEPEGTGGTTTGGDVPDNAVFLTYKDTNRGFSIQYVEGWQVTPTSDGVDIRDKDSRETVQVVPPVSDIAAYINGTDLPSLQQTDGFQLVKQDTVKVSGKPIDHLSYKQLSPPDPVTGKRQQSIVDRYYVPGTNGMAIVTLSTPEGVDNVDAFRQMIESFTWT